MLKPSVPRLYDRLPAGGARWHEMRLVASRACIRYTAFQVTQKRRATERLRSASNSGCGAQQIIGGVPVVAISLSRLQPEEMGNMLYFAFDAADSTGNPFSLVLQVPTQAGKGRLMWAAAAGTFSFMNGDAAIIASPPESRGDVVCIGADKAGKLWTVAEFKQVFAQFTALPDGSYGALALNQSGSGYTYPGSVVSIHEGGFTWTLTTLAPSSNTLETP
ncbi:MAG TPA: hypothetical protein VHZ24_17540 [Pirellulales bacterium]|nr:hypothetical protein [Pirellulales bacterium]